MTIVVAASNQAQTRAQRHGPGILGPLTDRNKVLHRIFFELLLTCLNGLLLGIHLNAIAIRTGRIHFGFQRQLFVQAMN